MTFSLLVCHAQQETTSLEDRIDSLEVKLKKLQQEHNILFYKHEFEKLRTYMGFLINNIHNNLSILTTYVLHHNFELNYYTSLKKKFDNDKISYSNVLIQFDYMKSIIPLFEYVSILPKNKEEDLKDILDSIEQLSSSVKNNLDIMDSLLNSYKNEVMKLENTKKSSKPKRNKRRPDYYD